MTDDKKTPVMKDIAQVPTLLPPVVAIDLRGPAGKRLVLATAKRMMREHSAVIKALANR